MLCTQHLTILELDGVVLSEIVELEGEGNNFVWMDWYSTDSILVCDYVGGVFMLGCNENTFDSTITGNLGIDYGLKCFCNDRKYGNNMLAGGDDCDLAIIDLETFDHVPCKMVMNNNVNIGGGANSDHHNVSCVAFSKELALIGYNTKQAVLFKIKKEEKKGEKIQIFQCGSAISRILTDDYKVILCAHNSVVIYYNTGNMTKKGIFEQLGTLNFTEQVQTAYVTEKYLVVSVGLISTLYYYKLSD